MNIHTRQGEVAEVPLGIAGGDPWAELVVVVAAPDGGELLIPAFLGGGVWRFRYSSEAVGAHRYRAAGPDGADVSGTLDVSGVIEVGARAADARGLEHGAITIADDGRHFAHADGTPFLWVGDTWWQGFVTEKISDDEFRDFARRRAAQGYSVIQIVVLAPEAGPFYESVRSRAGWPWQKDFAALNLAWWDDADRRIRILVEAGLSPCIVGSWGYHLPMMGEAASRRLWREMVARWGAYPVTWCLAGEPTAVWADEFFALVARLEEGGREAEIDEVRAELSPSIDRQVAMLDVLASDLRTLDPYLRPVTTHVIPGQMPWELVTEPERQLDFWMLQTGHCGYFDLPGAVDAVHRAYGHTPVKPVVNGEPSYEGISGGSWEDVQRFLFWSHLLSGTAGHTYGAHGVWAMNTPEFPSQFSGLAPMWRDAAEFSGGKHVGVGATWLRTLDWPNLAPRPELVTPHQTEDQRLSNFAAEFPDGSRIFYLPPIAMSGIRGSKDVRLEELGDTPWDVRYVDPCTGRERPPFTVEAGPDGGVRIPYDIGHRPSRADWLILARPLLQ